MSQNGRPPAQWGGAGGIQAAPRAGGGAGGIQAAPRAGARGSASGPTQHGGNIAAPPPPHEPRPIQINVPQAHPNNVSQMGHPQAAPPPAGAGADGRWAADDEDEIIEVQPKGPEPTVEPDVPPGYNYGGGGGGGGPPPKTIPQGHGGQHGQLPPAPPCFSRSEWDKATAFIESLNKDDVMMWQIEDIKSEFLKPLGMMQLAYIFENNRINGRSLVLLGKEELADLNIKVIGDRVYLTELMHVLRKAFRRQERDMALWQGQVPPENDATLAYFDSFNEYLTWKCCYFCVPTKDFRITKQGLFVRTNPAKCQCCCYTITNKFYNFSFMKDIDWYTQPAYCGCVTQKRMEMFFLEEQQMQAKIAAKKYEREQADKKGERGVVGGKGKEKMQAAPEDRIRIYHPTIDQELVDTITYAWSEARLVAGSGF